MTARDRIELLCLGAVWGGSYLFMRIAAPEFGAFALVEIRVAVAAAFLLTMLTWRGRMGGLRRAAARLTFLGAINSAVPFTLFAYAALHITAGTAAVLNASTPLFGALVALIWLRERLTVVRVLGLAMGFIGVLMLLWERASFNGPSNVGALLAPLAASMAYAVAANYTKAELANVDPIVVAAGSQIAASLLLLPLCLKYWPAIMPSGRSWLSVIALGIFCTGIAYVLYFRLIAHAGPTRAVTVTYLVPMFGMSWGALFLGEMVSVNMIVDCVVILTGIALATGTLRIDRLIGAGHEKTGGFG